MVTAASAVGKRIVKSLRGGGCAYSNICNKLGIECRIGIVNDGIVAATSLVTLSVECAHKLVAKSLVLLAEYRKGALDLSILDSLIAKSGTDSLVLAVKILVDIKDLLIGVDVAVSELDLCLKLGYASCLPCFVTVNKVTIGSAAVHTAAEDVAETAVEKTKCSSRNAETESRSCYALRGEFVFVLILHKSISL